jgi:hypothetical protein
MGRKQGSFVNVRDGSACTVMAAVNRAILLLLNDAGARFVETMADY